MDILEEGLKWAEENEKLGRLIGELQHEIKVAMEEAAQAEEAARIAAETAITELDPASYTHTGTCGENLQWGFHEETGELVVVGTGGMENYVSESVDVESTVPWYEHSFHIKK